MGRGVPLEWRGEVSQEYVFISLILDATYANIILEIRNGAISLSEYEREIKFVPFSIPDGITHVITG